MKSTSILKRYKCINFGTELNISIENISVALLSLIAFSLPFNYKLTTLSLILFGATLLFFSLQNKKKIAHYKWKLLLPWFAFYSWFAIGFFYSEDRSNSFKDLETKFSLLALPILIGLFTYIKKSRSNLIFMTFIIGMLCMEITSLFHAAASYLQNGQSEVFFYHQLVSISDINAAYFSWYLLFSILLLLFQKLPIKPVTRFGIIIFQLFFLFLLSSRASQLVFAFVIAPIALYHYRNAYRSKWYKGSAFLYLTLMGSGFINPSLLNERLKNFSFQNSEQAFLPHYNHHSYEFNEVNTRLFFWRVGMENILSHNIWMGVGNGDVNHVQNKKMNELGILDIYNEEHPSDFLNMNVHNMYLQSFLASGLIGLLLFLGILVVPLLIAIRRKNLLLLLFQLISIIFMLHESALQTQAGVVFYSFFSLFLINHTFSNKKILEFHEQQKPLKLHLSASNDSYSLKLTKRIFDIVIALMVLVPFSILALPLFALLIKLSSSGPVFFKQQRTGMDNTIFYCYKLRTMIMNDRSDTHQAVRNDNRITKIGYFLRVMHIDEIPQLFNVLRGEMSIIGPRPHMLYHTKVYSECIPYYSQRLKTKPGLTGLAQVKGFVGEIQHPHELKKRILSDIYYVKKSSWKLNFFILLMTVKNIIEKLMVFRNQKTI